MTKAALNQLRGAVSKSLAQWLILPMVNITSVPVTAFVISVSTVKPRFVSEVTW